MTELARRYRRREPVEAVQVTEDNAADVAAWVDELGSGAVQVDARSGRLLRWSSEAEDVEDVLPGQYVVATRWRYLHPQIGDYVGVEVDVYGLSAFEAQFEEVAG